MILHGRLSVGSRLPSTRQFARDLRVSRNIVVFAYEELKAEGYIVSEAGAGSRVAASFRRHPPDRLTPAERRPVTRPRVPPPRINEPGYRIGQPFEVDLPALDLFPQRLWAKDDRQHFDSVPARLLIERHEITVAALDLAEMAGGLVAGFGEGVAGDDLAAGEHVVAGEH
jgi:GntR family transcriptional regulator / MocR family aminotransferase